MPGAESTSLGVGSGLISKFFGCHVGALFDTCSSDCVTQHQGGGSYVLPPSCSAASCWSLQVQGTVPAEKVHKSWAQIHEDSAVLLQKGRYSPFLLAVEFSRTHVDLSPDNVQKLCYCQPEPDVEQAEWVLLSRYQDRSSVKNRMYMLSSESLDEPSSWGRQVRVLSDLLGFKAAKANHQTFWCYNDCMITAQKICCWSHSQHLTEVWQQDFASTCFTYAWRLASKWVLPCMPVTQAATQCSGLPVVMRNTKPGVRCVVHPGQVWNS